MGQKENRGKHAKKHSIFVLSLIFKHRLLPKPKPSKYLGLYVDYFYGSILKSVLQGKCIEIRPGQGF